MENVVGLHFVRSESYGRAKTRSHCGSKIASYNVAPTWQNAATLLRGTRIPEMFLFSFFSVQDTNFVSATYVARVAKRVDDCETWWRQQCYRHNALSFCWPGLIDGKSRAQATPRHVASRFGDALCLNRLIVSCKVTHAHLLWSSVQQPPIPECLRARGIFVNVVRGVWSQSGLRTPPRE